MAEAEAVAETNVYLIMLVRTAVGHDTQWFEFKASYFAQPTRVEWDKNTMSVALPEDVSAYLLRNGYARRMTEAEMEAYTAPPSPPQTTDEVKKSTKRRGDRA